MGEVTAAGADIFLLPLPKNPKIECLIDLAESLEFELRIDGDDPLVDAWSLRCFLWPTVSRVGSVHETSNMFGKNAVCSRLILQLEGGEVPLKFSNMVKRKETLVYVEMIHKNAI